jgi:DNA-binding CsgD family transcriptional regulator/tetratricopeptide (TPR) repeat protein
VVLISGEAGIGKTWLVQRLRETAEAVGGVVLVGSSPFAGASLAYAPLVEALRTLPKRVDAATLAAIVGTAGPEIARIVPSFPGIATASAGAPGEPPPTEATSGEPSPILLDDWLRSRTIEAIAAVLERLGELRAPAVLVLEDLQWADLSSIDAFAFLVRLLRDTRVLLVGTILSETERAGAEAVGRLVADLDREERVVRLDLVGLADDAITAIAAQRLAGANDVRRIKEIVRRADGNPFFAEQLASIPAGERPGPGIRATIRAQIGNLRPTTLGVLRRAALAGRRFEYPLMRAAAGLPDDELATALREAIDAGVLEATAGPWGSGFAFRHELVREALEEGLLPSERAAHHLALAAAIEATIASNEAGSGTDTSDLVARLARHRLEGGDHAAALPALVDAGRAAAATAPGPEAAKLLLAAVGTWDRLAAGAGRAVAGSAAVLTSQADLETIGRIPHAELLRLAAEVAAVAGDLDQAIGLARRIVAEADASGDLPDRAQATERLARFLHAAGHDEESDALSAELAFAADHLPPRIRSRVLAGRARTLAVRGDPGEARIAAERAIAAARDGGSPEDFERARIAYGLALSRLGEDEAARRELAAAVGTLEGVRTSPPQPSRILTMIERYADLAGALARIGERSGSAETDRRAMSIARELGLPAATSAPLLIARAERAFADGDWDDAAAATEVLLAEASEPRVRSSARTIRARVATGRGRYGEAAELLGSEVLDPESGPREELAGANVVAPIEVWVASAELGAWRGRVDDGFRCIAAGLTTSGPDRGSARLELLAFAIRLGADRADLARLRRDPAAVTAATDDASGHLAHLRALVTAPGRAADAIAHLRMAEAEWSRVINAVDPEPWRIAATSWNALGRAAPAAYAEWQVAERAAARRSGRDEARASLARAHAAAAVLGAQPLLERIESLARRARLTLDDGTTATAANVALSPRREVFGLSVRELEVLALVADGRTNRQIADALFISEKTAGHHVSNVLGKLGVASRVEAAAIAHRTGLATAAGAEDRTEMGRDRRDG